jgi:hypothetical protein
LTIVDAKLDRIKEVLNAQAYAARHPLTVAS